MAIYVLLVLHTDRQPLPQRLDPERALEREVSVEPPPTTEAAADLALRIDLPGDEAPDGTGAGAVSPAHPLQLELAAIPAAGQDEGLTAYADNQGVLLPLGYGRFDPATRRVHVDIDVLPEVGELRPDEDRSGGPLRVFLRELVYERLQLEQEPARLAVPQFATPQSLEVAGYETDMGRIREQVAAATHILLFVHGVIGNTREMAGIVNQRVDGQALGEGFLALTFDYENLNTPIRDIAVNLRTRLAAIGLDRQHDKKLIIIAHSMGGLVVRWLIEKDEAAPPVQRLIMLGVPNGGSPLQHIREWTQGLLTLALNGIALVKLAGLGLPVLAGILERDYDTLDELAPDSPTLQALYAAPDPQVPYALIAGDTRVLRLALDDRDSALNRLMVLLKQQGRQAVANLFTRSLFGDEPNDIAVTQDSMRHIAPGRQPAMRFYVTDCDHLSYFVHPPVIARIAGLLRE
ncbi:MAG TPA: hypothetical protein PLB10_11075 [Thiolinea sp.]|nr:hypothetical protein [Thiolinea sp.]